MSSEVDICNMALAHLGDSALVVSINPAEGSAQAEHCQRFYPIARDALLELHDWRFASTRAPLALAVNPTNQWQYAYARPANAVRVLAILDTDAPDDYAQSFALAGSVPLLENDTRSIYTPQKFVEETGADGSPIILTNMINATARYTRLVTDTARFSPLFRDALAAYLASYLAGPILKGETGIKIGANMMQIAMGKLALAKLSDAGQQRQDVAHNVPWLAGR